MKTGAIVLAAGNGSRMHSAVKKQFMMVGGKPLIWYSLQHFTAAGVDDIILVTGESDIEYCRKMVSDYGFDRVRRVTSGGKERYDSVYRGLCALKELGYGENDVAAIHDGARPFADAEIIRRTISDVQAYGTSIAAMPSKDTIKIARKMNDGAYEAVSTPDRSACWMIQTPQTFFFSQIKNAYDGIYADPALQEGVTDDAMVMERVLGVKCHLTEGAYRNIKVTTPEDLMIAEAFLRAVE
ncbi:MAG: 2-C-methyl-D-erythritol 4-phosphate cytidylyltransferase [Clostridium sp.]|nr:2-C-methyl-D-erythritol 4-phosphate cytidylyltransferase [Clostridium sp.]